MSTPTPGRWTLVIKPGDITVEVRSRAIAALLGPPDGETIANGHLIAAAPELADALEVALPELNGVAYTRAYQALVKAGRRS